jgi:hypothetical protein
MAQTLSSPGVSISVSDESMYTSAGAGTVPLILVATSANKLNGSKTGIAPGTLSTDKDYGKVRLLTSPRDLTDVFGVPNFKIDSNNKPIHGAEQNEYGLLTAYSYLNKSNRAFVLRADLDLDQLDSKTAIPTGTPENNSFWFDTASSHWGIFVWNSDSATTASGQTFANVIPTVITDSTKIDDLSGGPRNTIGTSGTYAVVAVSSLVSYWYKSKASGTWVELGSDEWVNSLPAAESTISELNFSSDLDPASDSVVINSYSAFSGSTLQEIADAINDAAIADGISATVSNHKLQLYTSGTDIDLRNTPLATAQKIGIAQAIYVAPAIHISSHLDIPLFKRKDLPNTAIGRPSGSIWIKTTVTNKGADWNVKRYDSTIKSWVSFTAPIYQNNQTAINALDTTYGGLNIAGNSVYVKYNAMESNTLYANFKLYRRTAASVTKIISKKITRLALPHGTFNISIAESVPGSAQLISRYVQINIPSFASTDSEAVVVQAILDELETKINSAPTNFDTSVEASRLDGNKLVITHKTGGEIMFVDDPDHPTIAQLFDSTKTANFYNHPDGQSGHFLASLWSEYGADRSSSFIVPSDTVPMGNASDGLLWFNGDVSDVDIMVKDSNRWVAYRNYDHGQGIGATNKKGPIISASKPTTQNDDDKSLLVEGDLWIDTSDKQNYPQIYKWINFTKKWVKIDVTDQTTENGIVFADARWNTNGVSPEPSKIEELLGGTEAELSLEEIEAANFVDFDCPDPKLYPKGCLLWNLRRSSNNVKRYHKDYVDTKEHNIRYGNENMTDYFPDRWVTESQNNEDGSGAFGRKAQRKVVVQALQKAINSNTEIQDTEGKLFNLIACPGYSELVGEMKKLNSDRGQTAFVIGDTPARLKPDATTLLNWGTNVKGTSEDDENGLVTADPYLAFFYPWGYDSDLEGRNVVVPPSYMVLRSFARSDASSFLWYAPAGTQRGSIDNATAVGYIDSNEEWQTVAFNTGQRDTLAQIKVNPVTAIAGSGLVIMSQYTRSPDVSALDRINVARLIAYLRRQFLVLSRGYLFQPNDDATRKQIKHAAESMLLELQGQRAIYDFVVVCDTTNNTPTRIDNSELHLDIAIEPTKAVEFIYIPMRLLNTGEVKTIGK